MMMMGMGMGMGKRGQWRRSIRMKGMKGIKGIWILLDYQSVRDSGFV